MTTCPVLYVEVNQERYNIKLHFTVTRYADLPHNRSPHTNIFQETLHVSFLNKKGYKYHKAN